jgi:hypothetical protein
MPLVLVSLKSSLANSWLVPEGGSYPDSNQVSGDRFATSVSTWFASAQAAGIPCSTASARKSQLASQAAAAIAAKSSAAAGQQLALAVASYIAGQSFGSGVAAFPLAFAAAPPLITSVFSNVDMPLESRAQIIASACTLLASSTLVAFAGPPFSAPIT